MESSEHMLLFSKRSTEARKKKRKKTYADDEVDESRAYQRHEVETEAEGLGTATGTDGAREDGRYERRQRRRPGPHRDGGSAAGHDFVELGVHPAVVASLASLGITIPTPVQRHCLPHAMRGSDVVAIATTGSGKTAAFAVPIVDALIAEPFGVMAVVLEPTRELAMQVHDQFVAIANGAGLASFRCVVCCGGYDMGRMCKQIERRPHVVAATPGRLRAVMSSGKAAGGRGRDATLKSCFKRVRVLVLDEADRLLEEEFEDDMLAIVKDLPGGDRGGESGSHGSRGGRQTMLFSATRTRRVDQIRKVVASKGTFVFDEGADGSGGSGDRGCGGEEGCHTVMNRNIVKTVEGLAHHYIFMPDRVKDVYLVSLLDDLMDPEASIHSTDSGKKRGGGARHVRSIIIFCSTCRRAQLTAYLLRSLTALRTDKGAGSRAGGGGDNIDSKRIKSNIKNNITVLHSRLNQRERTASLTSFKSLPEHAMPSAAVVGPQRLFPGLKKQQEEQEQRLHILIATDVASRGLDIPHVDVVVHYDVPNDVYDYVHRSGRTARAGRKGRCISLVTQYDVDRIKGIESGIGMKLDTMEMEEQEVLKGLTRVLKARRAAALLLDENPLREKRR